MGNTDSLPVVSQVKSGVQYVAGDSDGALKTQQNFIRGCPIVSQVTSAVQLIEGDTQGATETQMYCVKNLSNLADGIPVVGHVKGVVHYACVSMDAFQGEVPSASQILENRLPGRAPALRGATAGEAQCAEIHGLHQHHQSNGLGANPVKTITVMYDGTGVKAFARCGNCKRVSNYDNMGEVPTDALNGKLITLDGSSALNTAMDLLQTL